MFKSICVILLSVTKGIAMNDTLLADSAFQQKGYTISTDKELLNIDVIYDFLENESYWGKGVTIDRVQKAISNSVCFGVYHYNNLCGFARVITDSATFAYLCDVFIVKGHRGNNLGKWLMQNIQQHPEFKGLRRWVLATADAHGLYSQYGFVPVSKPEIWMEIFTPYTPAETQDKNEH